MPIIPEYRYNVSVDSSSLHGHTLPPKIISVAVNSTVDTNPSFHVPISQFGGDTPVALSELLEQPTTEKNRSVISRHLIDLNIFLLFIITLKLSILSQQ